MGGHRSDSRSEFSLLSDVLGLSSLVDLLASDPERHAGQRARALPHRGLAVAAQPGQPDRRATKASGAAARAGVRRRRPAAAAGHARLLAERRQRHVLADGPDAAAPTTCAASCSVDAAGRFEIATIRAVPYRIPTDGPVWTDLVEPAGRSAWRPAHVHLIVSAPGHRTLVTELFDAEDPYLDSDAVFGVRDALVRRYQRAQGVDVPVMEIDLVLGTQTP